MNKRKSYFVGPNAEIIGDVVDDISMVKIDVERRNLALLCSSVDLSCTRGRKRESSGYDSS